MHVRPNLDEMLLSAGGSFRFTAEDLLGALGWTAEAVHALEPELDEATAALEERYRECGPRLPFPVTFKIERETSLFLYGVVRLLRPEVIVETGVANGHSSFVLLSALERNGTGRLHSFDIDPRAGELVRDRERWSLTITDEERAPGTFAAAVAGLGGVDFFFHDADHRYLSQLTEYRVVWPATRPGGVFASDDVDDSRAFFDFSDQVARRPELLLDSTKLIGAHRV